MIASLFWKEYREHRSVWLALTFLGWVLLVTVVATFAPNGVHELSADKTAAFVIAALTATGTYGLVCGAMMLANEKESRTLAYLETLPILRTQLWRVKFALGVGFAALHGLALVGVVLLLGLGKSSHLPEGWYWALPLVAVEAFLFGLFGSALAQSVLTAILWAILPLSLAWILGDAVSWPPDPFNLFVRLVLATLALLVSWLNFCGTDLSRRRTAISSVRTERTSGWDPVPDAPSYVVPGRGVLAAESLGDRWRASKVLLWLAFRQGRALILGLLLVMAALGLVVAEGRLFVWLAGTLLIGVVCGVATFGGEMLSGVQRFLGEQRVPPGRLWAVKTGLWLGVALGAAGLLLAGFLIHHIIHRGSSNSPRPIFWPERTSLGVDLYYRNDNALLWLAMWLPYGFAVGQVCVLLWKKTAVAFVVAVLLSLGLVSVWLPSLLGGGLPIWQPLLVPVVLLAAGRVAMWTWTTNRLHGPRVGVSAAVVTGLVALWVGGGMAYRVLEVPQVGDPFDLPAFIRSLPLSSQNEAGKLLRQMADQLKAHEQLVTPLHAAEPGEGPAAGGPPEWQASREARYQRLTQLLEQGWPARDGDLGEWLDQMFAGEWFSSLRDAAALPTGIVEDPLLLRIDSPLTRVEGYGRAGLLLAARALQLQAQGNHGKALEKIVLALALARNVQHRGNKIHFIFGRMIETRALRAFDHWLQGSGARTDLLRRALHELARHESQRSPYTEPLLIEYLVYRNALQTPGGLLEVFRALGAVNTSDGELLALAMQTPWEQARALRQLNLLFTVRLQHLKAAYPGIPQHASDFTLTRDGASAVADLRGSPTMEPYSPGSLVFWFQLMTQTVWPDAEAQALTRLRAARLRVALLLYQQREGKPAASLADLLRADLTELPVDPFTGQSFRYRVSSGERIDIINEDEDQDALDGLPVRAGQGVLWSVGPDRVDHQGLRHAGNSYLGRGQASEWLARQLDFVFLVPVAGR